MTPKPRTPDAAWNPHSALALYPVPTQASISTQRPRRDSWIPWWASPLALVLLGMIGTYRRFVPVAWRRRCIYTPTCSEFGLLAIKRYGGIAGAVATAQRISRCNGTRYRGGPDPV